jgi:outer membrane immunogenic protein
MRVRLINLASLAALASVCALPVLAADYPVLRGTSSPSLPPPPVIDQGPAVDWNGFYFGGYGAAGQSDIRGRSTLRNAITTGVPAPYSNLANLVIATTNKSVRSTGFGVFAGYNMASDDALIGFEGDFGWLNAKANNLTIIAPGIATNGIETVTVGPASSLTRLEVIGSARMRAGLIFGSLMPYVTGGFAWGHAKTNDSATIAVVPGVPATYNVATSRTALMAGYTLGAGLEARFGNLSLRGEYIFTSLTQSKVGRVDVNQARFGAGVSF